MNQTEISLPFGGYKQSGIGKDLGEYALEKCVCFSLPPSLRAGSDRLRFSYTRVKVIHINIGLRL